ncbi:MAG: hypothetical protein U0P45_08505 [Acidimicrobiales bacterium]
MEARSSVRPSPRRWAIAALAVSLAALATACSGGGTLVGTNPAATVNGSDISRQQVADRVSDYQKFLKAAAKAGGTDQQAAASIQQFVQQELPNYEAPSQYATPNVGSADQLTQLITEQIFADALDAAGGKITAKDRSDARSQLESSLTQQGLSIDLMPKALADSYVELGAVSSALGRELKPQAPKALRDALEKAPQRYEARIRAIYDQDPSSFRQVCVFLMGAKSQAEAQALRDRVDGGEDFTKVATEASVIDPTAGTTSNCYNAAQLVQVFGGTVEDLTPGTVVGPATPDTTWLVAKVDTTKTSFDDVAQSIRDQVQDTFTTDAENRIQQWLAGKIDDSADVRVDPRYGTWVASRRTVEPNPTPSTIPTIPAGTPTTIPTASAGS